MSEWLDSIGALLRDSLGAKDKRALAYRAAEQMDKVQVPRGYEGALGRIKADFYAWVEHCGYLYEVDAVDHFLPESVLSNEAPIVNGKKMTDQERMDNRAKRVSRCLAVLQQGWQECEAITFVASREEWRDACRRAGRVAA